MKNIIRTLPHIIIWTIILSVPIYLMYREGTFDYKPYYNYISQLVVFGILFYINYFFLIEKYLFDKKIVTYILINVGMILILSMIHNVVTDYIWHSVISLPELDDFRNHRKPGGPPRAMRYIFDTASTIFVIGLSVAIKTTIRWYSDSISLEKAKRMQLEADLRNLRSQLNPHFLFNTLNNIYSLIAINQDKAQDAIHRLSALLRYVMYGENEEKFAPIDKELEFTRNYIDLMKLRLADNVKLDVLIEDKGSSDLIAPFMFITLIENAFKHGINNGVDSFIQIDILVNPGKGVLCTVKNSLPAKETNQLYKSGGIGLANLSRRLELLYPNRYEFVTEERANCYFALLRLDFGKENITV